MFGPVLVLNANFEPIHVCSTRRAINLILSEKASLVLGVGSDAQRVTIHKGEKPWYSSGGSPGEGFDR